MVDYFLVSLENRIHLYMSDQFMSFHFSGT